MVQTPNRRYDPELVPPEWSQWLKMTRLEPPSEEEIAGYPLLPADFLHSWKTLLQLLQPPLPSQKGTGGRSSLSGVWLQRRPGCVLTVS